MTTGGSGVAQGYAYADIPFTLAEFGGTLPLPLFAQWKVFNPRSAGVGVSQMLTWRVWL